MSRSGRGSAVSRLVGACAVVELVVLLGGGSALAAAGALDPGFNGTGTVVTPIGFTDMARAVALQPDGKIVVAGDSVSSVSQDDFALARHQQDGSLDTSFGGNGTVTTAFSGYSRYDNDGAYAVAVQPDGKIVAAGYDSNSLFALARYKPNGSLDHGFGCDGSGTVIASVSAGGFINRAFAVAVQPDGKIVAAGTAGDRFALARFNPNGCWLDTSFNGSGRFTTKIGKHSAASAVALQPDGKIVAAGWSYDAGRDDFALARYNPDGVLDTSFNRTGKVLTPVGAGDALASAVALQPDGKLVVAGEARDPGTGFQFALARYNSDGSLDTTFNGTGKVMTPIAPNGGYDRAMGVAVQPDGKIVAAGFSDFSGTGFALARYNPDGSLDTSFNGTGTLTTSIGGAALASGVALQSDGKIVAAGWSNSGSGPDHFALARYCGGDPCDAVPATLTVKESLQPASDAGRFSLLVDSTVVKAAAVDGGAGTSPGAAGTHRIGEVAVNGTNLSDYASSVACTRNGAADVSASGTSVLVSVAFGDVETCTFTNVRRATVTLRKSLSPAGDPGRFTLKAGSKAVAAAVGDGGSGSVLLDPGSFKLGEKAASGPGLAAYASSIACRLNGSPGPSGGGTTLAVAVAPGDALDCTFTNVRKATVTLRESLSPAGDPGRFTLKAGSKAVAVGVGDGGSGSVLVDPGALGLSERAVSGPGLAAYTSSIACLLNGYPGPSGGGTALQVAVAPADVLDCTFTNVRKP